MSLDLLPGFKWEMTVQTLLRQLRRLLQKHLVLPALTSVVRMS